MSGVDIAGLVERVGAYLSTGGLFNPELADHDAVRDLVVECRDVLLAQAAELAEARTELTASRKLAERRAQERDRSTERADENWFAYGDMIRQRDAAEDARQSATRQRDEALAALKAAEERVERLSQALASARCPQEPWRATPERITQKYLRRYPNSKAARSWAGCMVHISTEHGVWRINGQGYTRAGKFDAWVLPFEEAQEHVAHCGPEKEAAFIKVVQPIGSGPSLADATNNPPSDPGTEQREAGV